MWRKQAFKNVNIRTVSASSGLGNRHGICCKSTFMNQEIDRPKSLATCLYRLVKCYYRERKPVFAEKRALTRSTESVPLSPNKRAQELLC